MSGFASVKGTETIHARPQAFIAAFVRRVESGLLSGTPSRRSSYLVTRKSADGLEFRAVDWLTAFNVGLNDVELTISPDGRTQFQIRYARWAGYALALGAAIGLAFIAIFLTFDIRGYIARHPESRFGGLSTDQNVVLAWAMALFWAFIWPWLLILMHQRPLRRLMKRLIAEVDNTALETGSY